MIVDICFSPILYPYYKSDKYHTIIIIDVFRATSTINTALHNGASGIIPVEKLDEVAKLKEQGFLVGGERNVERCDFADFGNSPFEYTRERVEGQDIAFSTTNGTRALNIALGAPQIIMGSFLNLDATIDFCGRQKEGVLILCSGWRNKINKEDTLCGGAIASRLISEYKYSAASDSVRIAESMWKEAQEDILAYLKNSDHYERLKSKGLEKDIEYCLTLNSLDILPIYNAETNKITIYDN